MNLLKQIFKLSGEKNSQLPTPLSRLLPNTCSALLCKVPQQEHQYSQLVP